jgi:IS1 family transposase
MENVKTKSAQEIVKDATDMYESLLSETKSRQSKLLKYTNTNDIVNNTVRNDIKMEFQRLTDLNTKLQLLETILFK